MADWCTADIDIAEISGRQNGNIQRAYRDKLYKRPAVCRQTAYLEGREDTQTENTDLQSDKLTASR